jgi:hypothetical protein
VGKRSEGRALTKEERLRTPKDAYMQVWPEVHPTASGDTWIQARWWIIEHTPAAVAKAVMEAGGRGAVMENSVRVEFVCSQRARAGPCYW